MNKTDQQDPTDDIIERLEKVIDTLDEIDKGVAETGFISLEKIPYMRETYQRQLVILNDIDKLCKDDPDVYDSMLLLAVSETRTNVEEILKRLNFQTINVSIKPKQK